MPLLLCPRISVDIFILGVPPSAHPHPDRWPHLSYLPSVVEGKMGRGAPGLLSPRRQTLQMFCLPRDQMRKLGWSIYSASYHPGQGATSPGFGEGQVPLSLGNPDIRAQGALHPSPHPP